MIKLYHISFEKELDKTFEPRVPNRAGGDEERLTPRICFSDSIGGCLQAVCFNERFKVGDQFVLYELEIDENDENLFNSNYLYENKLVPDALETGEFWLTKAVSLKGKLIEITNMEARPYIAWSSINTFSLFSVIYNTVDDCRLLTDKIQKELQYIFYNIEDNFILFKESMKILHNNDCYELDHIIEKEILKLNWASNVKYTVNDFIYV